MAASIAKFWQELKRRKVVRVAVAYALAAWVVEVAAVTAENGECRPLNNPGQ